MNPKDKNPGKFYCLFKVHKPHTDGFAPPVRPIISGSGSILENIGQYLTFHLKDISNKHDTFIQDTPDFLRKAEKLNISGKLPENAIIVTMDVSALYTNIEKKECIDSVKSALEEESNPEIPIGFVLRLLEVLLENNIFTFNNNLYKQIIGVAMGCKPAPLLANVFMSKNIDSKITQLSHKIKFFKRFLDDIFLIYIGSTVTLHEFFHQVNNIHPHIKFTFSHTSLKSESEENKCDCPIKEAIPFLDTSCQLIDGKLIFDLYRKETDRVQYLLPSSCHPIHSKKNIPFSLAMRINRICSTEYLREKRFSELRNMLLSREYKSGMIDAAIRKARNIPRVESLRPVVSHTQHKRSVFVTTFDPRLPNIQSIQTKHWRSMVNQDQYLSKVFPEPPMVAYKRPKNIRDMIIRAKIPILRNRHIRVQNGMKKCPKNCAACPFIKEVKCIKNGKNEWKIRKHVDCQTSNIVYMIECQKQTCQLRYIGETIRTLKTRFLEHKGYIKNKKLNQPTGHHFNSPGHSIDDLKIFIIEKVRKQDDVYRKIREQFHINKFNTYYEGMNNQH